MASREAFPFSAEGPRMKWKSGQGLKTSDPPESADVRCPTAFCKTHDRLFQARETTKFHDGFIHCLNYDLAATVSERI